MKEPEKIFRLFHMHLNFKFIHQANQANAFQLYETLPGKRHVKLPQKDFFTVLGQFESQIALGRINFKTAISARNGRREYSSAHSAPCSAGKAALPL